MAEVTVTPPCARHPEQASIATCGRCGQPLCEQCRVESVATEQVFCSERCLEAPREAELDQETVSNKALREGLKKPIRIGWALWGRSVGSLVVAVLPLAVVGGVLWWYMARSLDEGVDEYGLRVTILIVALLVIGAYGVAVVGIMLSQRHTRLVRENPHTKAARRFIPWMATWFLVIAITMVGYFALILPGIYLAIRLFWADEFALIHDKGPIAALKASWELTRKAASPVFHFQIILGFAQYLVIIPAAILVALAFGGLTALGMTAVDRLSIAEAFIFAFVGLVVYSAMHAPEIVQFYGMKAARASLDAVELEQGNWLEREKNRQL